MSQQTIPVDEVGDTAAGAVQAARHLAAVLAATPEYLAFDAAHRALRQRADLTGRLNDLQGRRQQAAMAAAWGGANADEMAEIERQWAALLAEPPFAELLSAQERLAAVIREAAEAISSEIEVDFAMACAPSGCCG